MMPPTGPRPAPEGEDGKPPASRPDCFELCGISDALPLEEEATLEPEEALFSVGEPIASVWRIEAGSLLVRKRDHLDRLIVTQVLRPGAWCGMEALTGVVSRATVVAAECSRVRRLPIHGGLPAPFVRVMLDGFAFQILQLNERLRDFGLMTARARAASVLVELAAASGTTTVSPQLSRQDLAGLAGMAPETFIRVLSAFRAQKLVETQGRRITLLEPCRLGSMAGRSWPSTSSCP